jgi:hypothetical protein
MTERRCVKCGAPKSNHPYRHVFVAESLFDGGRMSELEARVERAEKERDEWKAASTKHHPNPADHRYWEGRYRDEVAENRELQAKLCNAETELARLRTALNKIAKHDLQAIAIHALKGTD